MLGLMVRITTLISSLPKVIFRVRRLPFLHYCKKQIQLARGGERCIFVNVTIIRGDS